MRREWEEIESSLRMLAVVLLLTLVSGAVIVFGGLWIAGVAAGYVR